MAAPVSGSVELTLAESGDIVQLGSGGGELASRASGSVTVNFTQAMAESPRVSLLGPSVVCASAGWRAAFRAVPEQDLGRPLSYSWNISLERETTLRQSDTLTIWQGINAAIATEDTESTDTVSSYSIDSSALVPGSFNYEVFVKAQAWTGASQIESRPFRVSSSGLSVSVTGPARIGRSGVYTYHVTATSCDSEQDGTADSLTYSWHLPGVSPSHMDGLNSRTLRVDTSELVWQSEYRLTCVVSRLGSSEVYTESLRLRPASSGVRARLPAERRAVQPEQPIYLDGSRSEDLAGRPGKLSYSWSCRLAESGAGCFVGDPREPPLQRLEQRLGDSALSGPTLRVPAGLLAPEQRYLLTLRVEKDGDVDTAHTEVYVNALPTPKLWIDRQTDVFDPFQDIFVSAQVSTDWPVTVQWETDFPLPPAALEGASFRPTLVPAGARRRHFDLVLPALETAGGEDGCTLCGKVLRFVLRADMETGVSLVASAEVDLTMKSAPSLGELKVSSADGLMTALDASEGWSADSGALQLTFQFGFITSDGMRVPMVTTVGADLPRTELLLPRGATQVYVRVCPADGVCLTVESDVTPKQGVISEEAAMRELSERQVEVHELGLPVEVLGWSVAILDRLPTEQSSAAENLTAIVHFTTRRALSNIATRLRELTNSENVKQKTRAVDQALTALELLSPLEAALAGQAQFDLTGHRSTLQQLVGAALLPSVPQTFIEQTLQVVPQQQIVPASGPVPLPVASLRSRRSRRRPKRAVASASSTQPLDASQAARLLSTAEGSSNTGALLTTARAALAGLCAGLPSTNSPPVAVLGYRLQLQAARRALDTAGTARWPLVEHSESANGTWLQPSAQWTGWSWECGGDPELQVAVLCRDMCVTTWVTEEDLLTASSDRLEIDPTPRRTPVFSVSLLHPVSLEPQYAEQTLKSPFIISTLINASMEMPEGKTLECRSWQDEEWSADSCQTDQMTGGELRCKCTRLGAVAAFEVDAPEPTTTVPTTQQTTTTTERAESNTQLTNITLRIEADYQAVVGDDKEQFESHMKTQIAASMNISESSIISISARPGSILLDLTVETSAVNQRTATATRSQDPLQVLTQLVQSGQLELTDLQGNRLVIPRDGLDDVQADPVKEERNTRTAVIIGAVIAAIVVICVIGVIAAVVIKNKKRSKVGSMTSPTDRSQQNTYKSFQFEHVMDGTAASLEKYRSSRGMDDSDRYLAETMRAHSAAARQRRASVPRPARYDTPSREQLDATQAVPESVQEAPAP